jgi:hypothetical protein
VLLMAADEATFGRISTLRRCWAPPGERPIAPRQVERDDIHAYTAVAPSLGRMTTLLLPYANAAMMSLFLARVGADFADYLVVMQVDRAGWHRADDLVIPENIRLLFQPARGSELNPVEHIWDYPRETAIPNRAFATLDALMDDLCIGFRALAAAPDRLRSMTNFPHLRSP